MVWLTVVCALLAVAVVTDAKKGKTKPPRSITFFVREKDLPPNNTEVFVASPSGNLTTLEFGTLGVGDDPNCASASNTSAVVGKTQYFFTVLDNFNLFWQSGCTSFTSSEYEGTITWSGVIDLRKKIQEMAVTGGTGDFRFVRGYVITENIVLDYVNQIFVV